MDDNARPHRTLAFEELLESEDTTRMDWPAYSLDLNPIEHVWDVLDRRIAARLHHPENTQQLKQMLIEELALLPQEMLHQLVLNTTDSSQFISKMYWLASDKLLQSIPTVVLDDYFINANIYREVFKYDKIITEYDKQRLYFEGSVMDMPSYCPIVHKE
ncbi:transposable element Tc1 transposase [Trichonephila clavipes]|nr:transposable element Tc1 transposase [Trichonephila clavipes]